MGSLRYARVDNSPLVVEGRTTGVLGIARDITEQKEERERAARADKLRALGQLASGVAHDFNNSLAAILGRAQLLRRQMKDEALVRNLEIIQTAAEDAAATVRRIQTFARKSPAKEFEILDVAACLTMRLKSPARAGKTKRDFAGLDYEVTLDAEAGQYTFGSASELREVFVNLIVNAVDAMPEGGKLRLVRARRSVACVAICRHRHRNAGRRETKDFRSVLYDQRRTGHRVWVYRLVTALSNGMKARSVCRLSWDGGTVFTIDLPAVRSAVGVQSKRPLKMIEMPSLSILVIDDEPVSARNVGRDAGSDGPSGHACRKRTTMLCRRWRETVAIWCLPIWRCRRWMAGKLPEKFANAGQR